MDVKNIINLILSVWFSIIFCTWLYLLVIGNVEDALIASIVLIIVGYIFRKNNDDFV